MSNISKCSFSFGNTFNLCDILTYNFHKFFLSFTSLIFSEGFAILKNKVQHNILEDRGKREIRFEMKKMDNLNPT